MKDSVRSRVVAPSTITRMGLGLINLLGLWLCAGVVALLRTPWHTPAMLANLLAAAAFALALCAAVRGGISGRLVALAGGVNVLAILAVLALAAWELASGVPWQSAAGMVSVGGAVPAINAAWWLASQHRTS